MRRATLRVLVLLLVLGGAVWTAPPEAGARSRGCPPKPPPCAPPPCAPPPRRVPDARPKGGEAKRTDAPLDPMRAAGPEAIARSAPRPPESVPAELRAGLRGVNREAWLLDYVDHLVDLRLEERARRERDRQAQAALAQVLQAAALARTEAFNLEADERQARADLAQVAERLVELSSQSSRAAEQLSVRLDDLAKREQKLVLQVTQLERQGALATELEAAKKDAALQAQRAFPVRAALDTPDAYRAWIATLSKPGRQIIDPGFQALEVARRRAAALRAAHEAAETERATLGERISAAQAKGQTQGRVQVLRQIGVRRAEQERAWAKAEVRRARASVTAFARTLIAQELLPYSIQDELRFSVNLYTGAAYAALDSAVPGLSLGPEQTRALFAGTLRLRAPDPLVLVATAVGATRWQRSDDYRARRAAVFEKPGAAYYASHRFVRFAAGASPVRRLVEGLTGQAPAGGGAVPADAFKRQILLEYHDLAAWLSLQGVADIEANASAFLRAALEGTRLDLPLLSSGPEEVSETARTEPAGRSFLPAYLRKRYVEQFRADIEHVEGVASRSLAAFGARLRQTPPSTGELLLQFDRRQLEGRDLVESALPRVVATVASGLGEPQAARLVGAVVASDAVVLDRAALARLGLTGAELRAAAIPGWPLVDLRLSPAADRLARLFRGVALGSRGRLELQSLELDLRTYRLSGTFRVTHETSFGPLATTLR